MDPVEVELVELATKPWWREKTLWAGVALIATGVGAIVADDKPTEGLAIILNGLGLIFLRRNLAKLP